MPLPELANRLIRSSIAHHCPVAPRRAGIASARHSHTGGRPFFPAPDCFPIGLVCRRGFMKWIMRGKHA